MWAFFVALRAGFLAPVLQRGRIALAERLVEMADVVERIDEIMLRIHENTQMLGVLHAAEMIHEKIEHFFATADLHAYLVQLVGDVLEILRSHDVRKVVCKKGGV